MLNELLTVERAARQAGFSMMERDRSIKDAGRKATLVVALDEKGHVSSVRPLAPQVRAWTLRDGQHNSFPFVQPSSPLWKLDARNSWRDEFLRKVKQARRDELLLLEESAQFEISDWPGDTFVRRLRERGKQFASLKETDASVVRTTIGRFLRAVRPKKDRDGQELLKETIRVLLATLKENPQDALIKVAVGLLVGKKNKDKWVCNGALIFEAAGSRFSIVDQSLVNYVSKALMSETDDNEPSVCALTGEPDTPHIGNFPQPTLPAGLGQTWLFAKNKEIPANGRYGRYAAEAMLVGSQTVVRLDAALRELTTTEREDKTWRGVPGEVPKQNDLLLAFVDSVLEAPVAGSLVEEDLSDATTPDSDNDSIGAFEKRTERLIDLVKAKVGNDITKTPVRMILLRKVDQANRKVVYSDTFMVTDLYCAAIHWTKGERNVPQGLSLPVLVKGESRILPPLMLRHLD